MISGEWHKVMQKATRWPCGVYGIGVGNNSIYCTCQKLVHMKCTGIKGSMSKVMKSFICRGCMNPVSSTGHTSVDCRFWCRCKSGVSGLVLLFS